MGKKDFLLPKNGFFLIKEPVQPVQEKRKQNEVNGAISTSSKSELSYFTQNAIIYVTDSTVTLTGSC